MKECPFCGEEIQSDAVKCRYCREWLNVEKKEPVTVADLKLPLIWPGYILAAIILIGDLAVAISNNRLGQLHFIWWTIPSVLIGIIYWNVCVYKIHKSLFIMANNCYPISPGRAVCFGFLPFYNFYWLFKWPREIINFAKKRSDISTWKPWVPGLALLISALTGGLEGGLFLIVNFGVLTYLSTLLKRSLGLKPEPAPYKSETYRFSAGVIVAIVFACIIPIIGLLSAIAVPNFIRARLIAQANMCVDNLRHIQMAKESWAKDTDANESSEPKWSDLVPRYMSHKPVCPSGGEYRIGQIGANSTCSVGRSNTKPARYGHILE